MGVPSPAPGGAETKALDVEATDPTRAAADARDGTERLLRHGRCEPRLPGELEALDARAA